MLTKLPFGRSSSREERGREGRLRLRERRWRREEAVSSVEEAPATGVLFVVDLNAAVAIGRSEEREEVSNATIRV